METLLEYIKKKSTSDYNSTIRTSMSIIEFREMLDNLGYVVNLRAGLELQMNNYEMDKGVTAEIMIDTGKNYVIADKRPIPAVFVYNDSSDAIIGVLFNKANLLYGYSVFRSNGKYKTTYLIEYEDSLKFLKAYLGLK